MSKLKGMPHSKSFCKRIFLHVITSNIIVPLLKTQVKYLTKPQFHQEGRHEYNKTFRVKLIADFRWNGSRKIETDIDSILLFSIIVTNKTPELFIYNGKDKKAMPLESSIPWERSF